MAFVTALVSVELEATMFYTLLTFIGVLAFTQHFAVRRIEHLEDQIRRIKSGLPPP